MLDTKPRWNTGKENVDVLAKESLNSQPVDLLLLN
jgi:hypothetical protein